MVSFPVRDSPISSRVSREWFTIRRSLLNKTEKKRKKKLKKKNESQAFTVQLYSFTLTTYLLSRRVVYFTLPRYHIIHIVALLVLP